MTKPEKPDQISQEDWDAVDVPDMTDEDVAGFRPFRNVFPAQFAAWKNKGGRPKIDSPKKQFTLRLAADVVSGIKATGRGYNGRLEKLISDALAAGKLAP